jgi:hypothetical protein
VEKARPKLCLAENMKIRFDFLSCHEGLRIPITLMWIRIYPACHFDLDPDPDPACHFGADPDPSFHFYADPDPSFQIKTQNLAQIGSHFIHFWLVISNFMRIRIQLTTLMRIRI